MRRAGFVLVGGRSVRMGRDKALLPVAEGTLLQQIAGKAQKVTSNVALVGDPLLYGGFGFDCLPDAQEGFGPLGGIYTALASGRGDYNLMLACDMPHLRESALRTLFAAAESTATRCVAACDAQGRVHPLCAVYRADAVTIVAEHRIEKRLRLMDLLAELRAVLVPVDCILPNCNTPEEWAAASRA